MHANRPSCEHRDVRCALPQINQGVKDALLARRCEPDQAACDDDRPAMAPAYTAVRREGAGDGASRICYGKPRRGKARRSIRENA